MPKAKNPIYLFTKTFKQYSILSCDLSQSAVQHAGTALNHLDPEIDLANKLFKGAVSWIKVQILAVYGVFGF